MPTVLSVLRVGWAGMGLDQLSPIMPSLPALCSLDQLCPSLDPAGHHSELCEPLAHTALSLEPSL